MIQRYRVMVRDIEIQGLGCRHYIVLWSETLYTAWVRDIMVCVGDIFYRDIFSIYSYSIERVMVRDII